ncbi:methyl-accepting chemotaxis protein [Ferruginivarius sediminum]|uniref:Methyl-accepting chemotaxis protein n=1 Tax=Ferruginivarius sediminum TaxID=2661937 RepID=A0A369TIW7_9PROT|nr:methyl-accepting chemotaxis protein [Ferruginivarius sediminum]RDD62826.1 methyl-accepting chemotaxis protein [Ferruginivarius sediminum]
MAEHAANAAREDDLLQKLAEETGGLGIEIADVAGNVDDISGRVREQAQELHGLLNSATEVSTNNSRIAEAARSSREEAEGAAKEVETSRSTVEESLKDIHDLVEAVNVIQQQLNGLQEALNKVAEVASGIDAIAKQTNLLALNATIEAARAGEAGKGFAVVAGEVKELAGQTSRATAEIDSTLQQLTDQAERLISQGQDSTRRAEAVREGTQAIGGVIDTVGQAMSAMQSRSGEIAEAAETIEARCDGFVDTVQSLHTGVDVSGNTLTEARDRINNLTTVAQRLIGLTAQGNVETIDTPFIEKVREVAVQVGGAFESALANGEITERQLFDQTYTDISGTDPVQKMAPYTELTDRLLPDIQEPLLSFDDKVVFCATVDRNGYLPTHNLKFSKPQGDDPVWNAANSRNRRIFDDRVGLAAGQNTQPFLLQAYRRDMGGTFVMMKDVSAPVFVNGRHWGGVRLAYKA